MVRWCAYGTSDVLRYCIRYGWLASEPTEPQGSFTKGNRHVCDATGTVMPLAVGWCPLLWLVGCHVPGARRIHPRALPWYAGSPAIRLTSLWVGWRTWPKAPAFYSILSMCRVADGARFDGRVTAGGGTGGLRAKVPKVEGRDVRRLVSSRPGHATEGRALDRCTHPSRTGIGFMGLPVAENRILILVRMAGECPAGIRLTGMETSSHLAETCAVGAR